MKKVQDNKHNLTEAFEHLSISEKASSKVLGGYKWRTTILWIFDDGPREMSENVEDRRLE